MSARLSAIAIAVSSALLLSACGGGGGGSGGTAAPATVISGTAAAGSPIIGKVTIKDSLGAQKTVDIEADGKYRIDVAGMTGPFLFRAAGTVGGRDVALVSAATSADVGNTINITPFTDLIVANIAGMAAEQYFANNTPSATTLTAAELSTATTTLTARLKPVLDAMGVAGSIDLLRTAFSADRSGLDAVMDVVKVTVDPLTAQATIKNLITSAEIHDDLANKTDAAALPAPTTAEEAALKAAVTDLGQIEAIFKLITGYFATEIPSGAKLASLRALFDPEYLDFGQNLDQLMSTEGILNTDNVGVNLSNPVIVRRSTDGSIMWVRFHAKNDNSGEDSSETMAFRKDAGGNWRALGNRQLGETTIKAVNARHLSGGQYTYQRNIEFWVANETHSSVQYVSITGPGLPGAWTLGGRAVNGLVLNRSAGTSGSSFVVLNKLGNSQGGSWVPLCGDESWFGIDNFCVDGSQLGVDNEYTVTYYDAGGNKLADALGDDIKVTVPRAPVSNADALANASQWFAEFTAFAPATISQIVTNSAITLSWRLPGDAKYVPNNIGFSATTSFLENATFNQDVKPTATVGVVGIWSAAASPLLAAATSVPTAWIHVKGPYERRFVTSVYYPM